MQSSKNKGNGQTEEIRAEYRERLQTAEDVAARVQDGWVMFTDAPMTQPYGLMRAVEQRIADGELHGVRMNLLLDAHPYRCYTEELADKVEAVSWFSGAAGRKGIADGFGDIMPCLYHTAHTLIENTPRLDLWMLQTPPMDEEGFFTTPEGSLGEALKKTAKHIFIQVNKKLPRTNGAVKIHLSEVEAFCELEETPVILPHRKVDDISRAIGELIAEEIPDGATIQLGIGAIPDAVGMALRDKKHLGVHSELLTNSLTDLIRCGAVDNSRKPIHTGKTVATFMMGDQDMYDFLDGNPDVLFLDARYVNDPAVIAQHPHMISVNAALEVDFFGQAASESVGTIHISGSGGQLDFVQGAVQSEGGKSFIAFSSTANGGKVSRIRPTLTEGAVVTTGKNDVDCIVTEYGIARLRGRTVRERTRELIRIAHPKFREELEFAARQRHFL